MSALYDSQYKLLHELSNDLRLKTILENEETPGKCLNFIE